ncbi:hypothetical protein V5F38_01410 [Xanthobacter sp. V0B-10]|uniref:hypothetical protein n=1 Tax=Xanthobacter albus TaxID=3119929 RepID=UPI003728F82A
MFPPHSARLGHTSHHDNLAAARAAEPRKLFAGIHRERASSSGNSYTFWLPPRLDRGVSHPICKGESPAFTPAFGLLIFVAYAPWRTHETFADIQFPSFLKALIVTALASAIEYLQSFDFTDISIKCSAVATGSRSVQAERDAP